MNDFMQQQQLMELSARYHQHQQQQQQHVSTGDKIVPYIIPTRLNNTVAAASLQRPSKAIELLPINYEPTNLDICSGRGKRNWNHSGNVAFRNFIQHSTPAYMAAPTKNEKTTIVNNIVEDMRALGCKFLKEDSKTGQWYDIGDALAREKVGHSLRDQVTAYNRSNATNEDADNDIRNESSNHSHQRRPSLTLSDSGNETDARRSTLLDTTAVLGQFARRPSWIAGEFDASIPVKAQHNTHTQHQTLPLNDCKKVIPVVTDDFMDIRRGNVSSMIESELVVNKTTIPTLSYPTAITIPSDESHDNELRIKDTNEHKDTSIVTTPHHRMRRSIRESISMADVMSWDPKASGNTQVLESMFHGSVQSWEPRMSSTTSMLSVRRSAFMAGNTTLRRLTNVLRASDISIESLMDGIEFSDDESDVFIHNTDKE